LPSTKRAETDEFGKRLYQHEGDFEIADAVRQVAKQRGVSPTQIACAWIVQAPGVSAPIIGAKTHHLKELIEAVEIKLSAEEIATIEKPYQPHPVVGHEQPNARRMASAQT
jgi:1-deoxyxylulose-5-phosphate synthase